MANEIRNQLCVYGSPKDVEKFITDIQNDEYGRGSISFEKIIPCQLDHMLASSAQRIAWNNEHWGTKGNAYNCDTDNFNSKTFNFSTAWTSAATIISILAAQYAHLSFVLLYADICDIGTGCGTSCWTHGTLDKCDISPSYSQSAFEVAAYIQGYNSIEDMGWIYDEQKAEYVEKGVILSLD